MSTDHPERRATDTLPEHFGNDTLQRLARHYPDVSDAHVETIDMDAALPPGNAGDEALATSAPTTPVGVSAAQSQAQSQARLQLARFKGTFSEFETSSVTRVGIDDIKRGDVVEIRTIVGSIHLRIVDRIHGLAPGVGEILCECRYDLPNQWSLVHPASILLPVCTRSHVVDSRDGHSRLASRALKMKTNAELPDQLRNLLRESYFVDIRIHANPRPERLRPIDIFRAIRRIWRRLRAVRPQA